MKTQIINDALSRGLVSVIEETSDYLTDILTKNALLKNGSVTLQEAAFFKELSKEVLTEASEELLPDEVALDDGTDTDTDGDLILTDQSGNEYVYDANTGSLSMVNGDTTDVTPDVDSADEALSTPDDIQDPDALTESELITKLLLK